MKDVLYIVTRQDLAPGVQLAQACHAALTFAAEHDPRERWAKATLAVIAAPDEQALARLLREASARDVGRSFFREPDLAAQLTAIALAPGPETRKLCARLPTALKTATS